jgi:hypothetical protein
MTSLLDMLKETALRTAFTEHFKSVASRESLERDTLHKRLLLCLYALGTNLGIKRVSAGDHGEKYADLVYVRRRYLHNDQLRQAIAHVGNAIFQVRLPQLWGEATTACASDSKQFGAWDQNLLTEWHIGLPSLMSQSPCCQNICRRFLCVTLQGMPAVIRAHTDAHCWPQTA